MQRDELLIELNKNCSYDVVIIGGGATGLGIALDASTRGLKTLLLEKRDFSSGTSSRSTKLIHGGVRYLKQLRFKLIVEALRERKIILKNSPNISNIIPFIIPVYSIYDKFIYSLGLHLYEFFSFSSKIGKTHTLSKKETLKKLPFINKNKLRGGILYFDAQFNDSQFCIDLAQTAISKGANIINYCEVKDLIKSNGKVCGILFKDNISNINYTIKSSFVVNATGVFAEKILYKDSNTISKILAPSQGVHLVLDNSFGSNKFAMTLPSNDGRVIFLIPWLGKTVLGTTDTKLEVVNEEPIPLKDEIDFLINSFNNFSSIKLTTKDIKSVFAGLRPLFNNKNSSTSVMSREHKIIISNSGLITIIGGKWTTYRKMAEDTVDLILNIGNKKQKKCVTKDLVIDIYIKKKIMIEDLIKKDSTLSEIINKKYKIKKADIVYSIKYEMAQTLEDILARRLRLLFLDAKVSIDISPIIAQILAFYLEKDDSWIEAEILSYKKIAQKYCI